MIEFELDVVSVGPRWTYLPIGGVVIPVFLLPNDTLECEISCLGQYNQRCVLKIQNGLDVHSNLLLADPNGAFCPYLENMGVIQPLKKTKKMIQDEKARIDDFYSYLAWKYNLTDTELSLMKLNVQQRLEIIWMRAVCSNSGKSSYVEPTYITDDSRWQTCPEAASLQINLDRWRGQE